MGEILVEFFFLYGLQTEPVGNAMKKSVRGSSWLSVL